MLFLISENMPSRLRWLDFLFVAFREDNFNLLQTYQNLFKWACAYTRMDFKPSRLQTIILIIVAIAAVAASFIFRPVGTCIACFLPPEECPPCPVPPVRISWTLLFLLPSTIITYLLEITYINLTTRRAQP